MSNRVAWSLAFTLALAACSSGGSSGTPAAGGTAGGGAAGTAGVGAAAGFGGAAGGGTGGAAGGATGGAAGTVAFAVTSAAFQEGGAIPLAHECGPPLQGPGQNLSPPLSWTPGPAGTQSYAVVVRDVDAKVTQYPEGIIHWVIYDIPKSASALPQGVKAGYQVADPAGAKQANIQGSGFYGYFGMCSPNSVNTYVFTVHAMPTPALPGVTQQSSESEIAAAIEANSIAQAALSGES